MIVKRPFDFKGKVNYGKGWIQYNGVVERGWQVQLTKKRKIEMVRKRLVYETKEDKRAYIVHQGGSWFNVVYGSKTEKVQGKANAEVRRDELNNA